MPFPESSPCSASSCSGPAARRLDWYLPSSDVAFGSACSTLAILSLASFVAWPFGPWSSLRFSSTILRYVALWANLRSPVTTSRSARSFWRHLNPTTFDKVEWTLDTNALGNRGFLFCRIAPTCFNFVGSDLPNASNDNFVALVASPVRPSNRKGIAARANDAIPRLFSDGRYSWILIFLPRTFPAALADALDRTLPVSVLSAVKPDSHPALLRTQVN